MIKRFIIFLSFSIIIKTSGAQCNSPYSVLKALSSQLNKNYPLLDSLHPLSKIDFGSTEWSGVSKKDKKKIRKTIAHGKGYGLHRDSLSGFKFISALPIYTAFETFDSSSLETIKKNKPCYMISNPIFFKNNTRCYIMVSLIGGAFNA